MVVFSQIWVHLQTVLQDPSHHFVVVSNYYLRIVNRGIYDLLELQAIIKYLSARINFFLLFVELSENEFIVGEVTYLLVYMRPKL